MDAENLTLEQLAGQRLMVGFQGGQAGADLRWMITELKVGGVILFAENLHEPAQIRELCAAIQACARQAGQPPLFVAIDQEGGAVARLREPFTRFSGNPAMKDVHEAARFAQITAAELSDVGINMNMAPVLDVAPPSGASVMAERVFGSDPAWVARMGAAVIENLQARGIMAVAKHFPGIGRTLVDSHRDLPRLEESLSASRSRDLIPFETAISRGSAGIMLAHVCYTLTDADWPASLSPRIARELLRGRMGYDGLAITDDLDMGAIQKHFPIETVIHQVLAADIDIALICHQSPAIEAACTSLRRALEASPELIQRSRRAAQRILALKRRYLG